MQFVSNLENLRYVIETFSNLHSNVEVWKLHKLVEFHKFMELDFSNSIELE
jgi:hypothetical protein